MDNVNYVKLIFSLMTTTAIICGSLLNSFEKYLPIEVRQSLRYGKFSYIGSETFVNKLEVPKSWFKHFYVYSSVLTTFVLGIVVKVYFYDSPPPIWLEDLLDLVGGKYREARVSSACTFLAVTLFTMQCLRRFYDTQFVSVFGENSKMNLTYYIIGFLHYTGSIFAILLEAPKFGRWYGKSNLRFSDLNFLDFLATTLFLWAWYHQYKTTKILGDLRKDKKGAVVSQKYHLPQGDWFEYLSAPHSTAEILMYFSLTVILWENITWLFIFAWVLSNQVETILLSHWWYQNTFKDFPNHRKALIPLIY